MVKKEEDMDSHKGLMGWSFGFASLLLSIIQPIAGLIFGIVGLILCSKTQGSEWSRVGKKLSIVGIVISVLLAILAFVALTYLGENSELISQLQAGGY